ncbi:Permease of the drug/metabolite transporter (DMT) superfamily [Sulfitobacter brevis]|uniref:Permease of the drug/metabolite transporter (DMT) superfamily n=1 Tax=Sulfitobacter brevis TaxID=74348 RepID=A0A1I1UNB5_9RHOB|nr:DMT family transporter [Sulfitobacter brevis]SFD72352.1 Permease of the drug/metabolite transporter (DMT) superfamily [Sulfitobacter brevis]
MDNLRGALLMTLAMLGFAIEDMFIKLLANGHVPIGQILTMLGVGGAIGFGAIVVIQGQSLFDRVYLSRPIMLRGAGEMIGTLAFISAITLTPISSASAILQATPLVVTLGAALFLAEPVGWRRWSAILVGMFGVVLIIRPGMDSFQPLSLLALIAVLGLSTRDLATRRVPAQVTSMQLSFMGFLVLIPTGTALMAVTQTPYVGLDLTQSAYIACALIIGLFAYYGIVAAMRIGDVSFVTPFRYARLVFALVVGVTVFSETPDSFTLIGAAIIVASGVYTVLRERKTRPLTTVSLSKPGPAG